MREAVLGRGDSGSLVADIVLPAAREVARMERVRSNFAPILQIQIRAGETDLGREGLLRRSGGETASVGREIQGRVAGLCHWMRNSNKYNTCVSIQGCSLILLNRWARVLIDDKIMG